MADEHVAKDGKLYACLSTETLLNSTDFQIADFRGGMPMNYEETVVDWFGQSTVRKHATMVRSDPRLTISEVAFRTETFGELLGLDPERMAARKRCTAISAGGTEATLTTEPETDEAFEDNEQVIVCDESGLMLAGYVDNNLSDLELDVDDGAGAAVANIADIGLMADLDYTDPQYFTRADNVLFDIGDGQDYSCLIMFKRRRESVTEVLMAKTSDYDGTAYGTTAGWALFIDVFNVLHFAINDGTDAYIINGTTPIMKDEMHHVVVTYDESSASDCKIYLNGYDDTASRTGTLASIDDASNALAFSIGAESDGGAPYDGYIVDAAVYDNAVLTAANALAYASAPRAEGGAPSAWYPFTDAAASTTCDDEATAANSLDLTLVGGTTTNYGTHSRDQIAVVTANLLGFDHGMENAGRGGWTDGDAASTVKKDKQIKKYGGRSMRIANGDASQAYARHTVTTVANTEYTFIGWFRSPETPNGASQLVDVDATAKLGVTVTQAGATTGNTWYEIYFTFEAADTSTTIDLGTGSITSGEYGYWEGVQLFKNYVDTGGFETNYAGSLWALTGVPTSEDDTDVDEDTGTLCYSINSQDPATKYIRQTVTVVSGIEYTFIGRVKCGTAEKGTIVLSNAADVTLDNGANTSDYATVRHRLTAATTALTITIYGDGAEAHFDNFSVIKVNNRKYHFDSEVTLPTIKFMAQYTDANVKTNQLYFGAANILFQPIQLSNMDYVVHDLEVIPLGEYIHLVEN